MLSTLRSGFTSAVSRRAVPAARLAAEESRAALLERLYREHADRIYGLCLRMSGDRVRATELAQDVFVRAWEQLDRLQPGTDAGAWLWRLATRPHRCAATSLVVLISFSCRATSTPSRVATRSGSM